MVISYLQSPPNVTLLIVRNMTKNNNKLHVCDTTRGKFSNSRFLCKLPPAILIPHKSPKLLKNPVIIKEKKEIIKKVNNKSPS